MFSSIRNVFICPQRLYLSATSLPVRNVSTCPQRLRVIRQRIVTPSSGFLNTLSPWSLILASVIRLYIWKPLPQVNRVTTL